MNINDARNNIDKIDSELVGLLKKRMDLSKDIAHYKQENVLPIFDKTREREILNRVADLSGDELANYIQVLFSTLFSVSRSYQNRILTSQSQLKTSIENSIKSTDQVFPTRAVVACQGIEGAYSQAACDRLFSTPNIMYFNGFEGVFHAVDKGLCKYGVLPIENSTAGSVNEVYDLMKKNKFYIVRSIQMRIEHNLLTKKGIKLSDIKEIFSHEQAINQCSEFLKSLNIKVTVCENTAIAAKRVAESERNDIAALSSHDCAELYNLCILSDDVMNNNNNFTRFICISKNLEIYPGADKISLMLCLPHRPGSLYGIISRLSALGINLSKLESRPMPGKNFEFMFYFDIDANVFSPDVVRLLCELDDELEQFVYLGSYSEIF
ncbi:MAG: bifunctional chorismate mutase/prephenate dehydratase [Clostridia bacterium]|nr:bifunctional chorismate mutase/prephenate dehydratase [Clostridia bacterium]